ncbi:MAG TPA: hypothetical protein VFT32_04670 [Candidatus Eisenbacteria bacterium]|nr:hypothetical protein [Candidatus Eisenbacteria bacterium]
MPRIAESSFPKALLIALAVGGLLTHPDQALCIGADGHLAVEAAAGAGRECCPADGGESATREIALTTDSCGPCLDLVLPLVSVTRTAKDESASPLPLATMIPAFGNSAAPIAARAACPVPTPSADRTSTSSIHSVVIRC